MKVPLYDRHGVVVAHAEVDAEDFAAVAQFRWHRTSDGYAKSNGEAAANPGRMHRLILGLPPGDPREGDHINRDKLDNRRANLRVVTHAEQCQNVSARSTPTTSRFRGVHWREDHRCWRVRPRVNGRYHQVGHFKDEIDAALAAEAWRREHMPFAEPDPELAAALAEAEAREGVAA